MQIELEKLHFFAKPKLGLDAVGGSSALRIADTLAEVAYSRSGLLVQNEQDCSELQSCKSNDSRVSFQQLY